MLSKNVGINRHSGNNEPMQDLSTEPIWGRSRTRTGELAQGNNWELLEIVAGVKKPISKRRVTPE